MPAKFAMVIAPASTQSAPQRDNDDEAAIAEMAARVAAGPGFWTDWLAELSRQGLLEELLADGAIARALREVPTGHKYDRVLSAKMTVVCVLVACLFPGAGYDTVLATAFGLPGLRFRPGAGTPTGAAFSQARKLLGEQVMQRIFELDAAVPDADLGTGLLWKGLEVAAHVRTATFRWTGAAIGGYHDGENALADQLQDSFGPGILNLADRGFFSMDRWIRLLHRHRPHPRRPGQDDPDAGADHPPGPPGLPGGRDRRPVCREVANRNRVPALEADRPRSPPPAPPAPQAWTPASSRSPPCSASSAPTSPPTPAAGTADTAPPARMPRWPASTPPSLA